MARIVGPDGSPFSKIAIVGEAPGAQEEAFGRPFVGPAGDLLEQCLNKANITRSDCYITNVIKERPASNNIELFFNKYGWSAKGKEYVQQLKEELNGTEANVIVAVGNVALAALCGITAVTKWRGSVLESTLAPNRKVIPIIHPASALREYLFRYFIQSDLRRVKSESEFKEIRRTHRDLYINPSYEQSRAYLDELRSNKKFFEFDIEVVNQELSCISFAKSPTDCICIPFVHRPGGPRTRTLSRWNELQEATLWREVAGVLEDKDIPKGGQNVNFDISFLIKKNNIITKGEIHDTMVGHHLVYYDFPKGLDFLCSIYANEPYYKDEGKLWKDPNITDTVFWGYSAKDSAITFECQEKIWQEVKIKGVEETYKFTMRLLPAIWYMQQRGIKADRKRLETAKALVKEKTRATQTMLDGKAKAHGQPYDKKADVFLNVNSSKQCQEYFYMRLGYKPYTSRQTGNITTDDKAMTKLERKGCKEATYVKEIRGLRKLVSTYLDIEFDADSRLRCSYNVAGTVTGRLSSSQTIFGTGANFQNIPPEFKTFLVADEDHILLEFDKRQAEWVVVAYLTGDANMIEVVEKGLDAHARTARLMFGAPEDFIKKEDKIIGKTTDEELVTAIRKEKIPESLQYNPIASLSMRQAGKKSNHGFNYDLSPIGFADTWQLPLDESKRCYALYHKAYPAIKGVWHERVRAQLSKNRTIITALGRKRIFLDRWSDDLFKAAYAFEPQSVVADSLNDGIINIYSDQAAEMKYVDILGQVHDSVLIQYPIGRLKMLAEVCVKIKKYLETPITIGGRTFIIPTDVKIGYDWSELLEMKLSDDAAVMYKALVDGVIKLTK
jgi:DNA polymerase-1